MSKEQAIRDALSRIDGVSKFFGKWEIDELPNILWDDEVPERIVQGFYKNGNGILVATNKRVIFVNKGWVSLKVEDFPYDRISSIEYGTGLVLGKIIIYSSGNKAVIEQVSKEYVRDFADYVRARSTKASSHASTPPVAHTTPMSPGVDDPLSKLERLAKLRDQGAISPEEYDLLKKKLLAEILYPNWIGPAD